MSRRVYNYEEDKRLVLLLAKLARRFKAMQRLIMRWMFIKSGKRLHPILGKAISGKGYVCRIEDQKGVYHVCDENNRSEFNCDLKNECSTCMVLAENGVAWECYYWIVPLRKIIVGSRLESGRGKTVKKLKIKNRRRRRKS